MLNDEEWSEEMSVDEQPAAASDSADPLDETLDAGAASGAAGSSVPMEDLSEHRPSAEPSETLSDEERIDGLSVDEEASSAPPRSVLQLRDVDGTRALVRWIVRTRQQDIATQGALAAQI
eukprot:1303382-Prymnesium_polylepis.1